MEKAMPATTKFKQQSTFLVLAAEAAAALIAEDAIGGNSGVAIVGSAGSMPAFLEDYLHARLSGCGTLF